MMLAGLRCGVLVLGLGLLTWLAHALLVSALGLVLLAAVVGLGGVGVLVVWTCLGHGGNE